MSSAVFEFMMNMVFVFAAIMVVLRFAFYRRSDKGFAPVYFWGGVMFLAMAVSDLGRHLLFGGELHVLQSILFVGLTGVTMYLAAKQRRVLSVNV